MATDRVITCADCGQSFTFTASEQQFYSDRGYSDPRRCSSCRAQRKSERSGQSGGYGAGGSSYSGGTSYGGGSSSYGTGFGNGGGGYRGDRPQREMFEATCSACGKTARVPFRPSSGKPVYCNDCFALRRA